MEKQIFMRFISNILNVRVCCVEDNKNVLSAFEKECCFEKKLQPMYTANYLLYLTEHIAPDTFYEITDYLDTNLLLFRFQDFHFLVGPYVKNSFSVESAQKLLASQKLPASIFLSLKLYYNGFPQLSYYMISGTLSATMRTFFPNTAEYSYRKLTGFHEELEADAILHESNKTYAEILHRYEMENFFLRKIADGDVNGVKLAFDNISTRFYTSTDKTEQSIYSSNNTGFAVIRTLARKAAEQGGCSIVKIDEITQESIQLASKTRSLAELEQIQKNMLIRLTQGVADSKLLQSYSPLIRNVLSYLSLHYTSDITLSELADIYQISSEHLSRTFKKEIGKNISEYIAQLRIQKAAELLKTSKLSIAEIAMLTGYPDSNYFVKVFRKYQNMTPSAYRKASLHDF